MARGFGPVCWNGREGRYRQSVQEVLHLYVDAAPTLDLDALQLLADALDELADALDAHGIILAAPLRTNQTAEERLADTGAIQ